jgi:gas vesicle structural protein
VTVYGSDVAKESAMAVERTSTGSSLVEVLDRVLDKGIVIDAWVRLSLVGIDLVTVEARVVVASIATYLQFSESLGGSSVFTSAASAGRPLGVAASIKGDRAAPRRQMATDQIWDPMRVGGRPRRADSCRVCDEQLSRRPKARLHGLPDPLSWRTGGTRRAAVAHTQSSRGRRRRIAVARRPSALPAEHCYLCDAVVRRNDEVVRVHEAMMHRRCYEEDIRRGR